MLTMSVTAADFDTAAVHTAINPSVSGWHYGPIPNPNPGWVPPRQLAATTAGTQLPAVTTADNIDSETYSLHILCIYLAYVY